MFENFHHTMSVKKKAKFKSENTGISFQSLSAKAESSFIGLWWKLSHMFKTLTLKWIKDHEFQVFHFTENQMATNQMHCAHTV